MSLATLPSTASASLVCRTDEAALQELAEGWESLAGGCAFRSPRWLAPWWRAFRARRDELRLLTLTDAEGELLGLAPLYQERHALYGRVWQLLGGRRASTDGLGLLVQPGLETLFAERLAGWLGERTAEWDAICFEAVPQGDMANAAFAAACRSSGWKCDRQPELATWRIEFPDDWQEYLDRLSKSRRERIRRAQRRFFDSGRAEAIEADSPEQIREGLRILVDLHQRRRASLGQFGVFAAPGFLAFLSEVAQEFHAAGRLRLRWMTIDGRPVAVEFSLWGGHTVSYYQTGIEPELMELEPGTLALTSSLRAAHDEGCRVFDFLRGNEAYKASWRAEPVETETLRVAAPTCRGGFRRQAWLTAQSTRRALRRIRDWRQPAETP